MATAPGPRRAVVSVRALGHGDREWLAARLDAHWGGRYQARRGELFDVLSLPGLVAERRRRPVGVLLHDIGRSEAELALIEAFDRDEGIGSALLDAFRPLVADCRRVWLVTTNDNLGALAFYQRRGWRLFALRPGAVDDVRRRLKPTISSVGASGLPIRDELELEWVDR